MAKIFDSLNVYGTGTTSASTALNVFNSGSTNLLTVRNNGRVGIGTTSPEYVLDIISGNSRTYYDPSSAGGVFNISGSTNLPRFNVQTLTSGITPSISLGIRSYTDVVHPGYGKVGDSHIYSSAQSNGLNIISYLGPNTEDYIRFYAGQDANGTTPDLYINGSGTTRGYVGISNDSPTELLHLKSVESVRVKLEADTDNLDETHNSQLLLSQDGGGGTAVFGMTPDSINSLVIGVNSTSSLPNIHFGTRNDGTSFVTTADTKMIITNVGNVGIGTRSPNTKLEISSDNTSSVNNILRFTDTDGTSATNQMSGKIEFFTSDTDGVGVRSYIAGITDGGANGTLIFATTSGSSASLTGGTSGPSSFSGEKMRISAGGNVGIGTTNPTEKLTVSGNTNITGTLSVTGNTGLGTSSPSTKLQITANNNLNTANNVLRFEDTDTTAANNQMLGKIEFYTSDTTGAGVRSYIAGNVDASGNGNLIFATASGSSTSLTGGTTTGEKMRISTNGNVGIGISDPLSRLHVNSGNFIIDDVAFRAVNNESTPRGVFIVPVAGASSYNFNSVSGDTVIVATGGRSLVVGAGGVGSGFRFSGSPTPTVSSAIITTGARLGIGATFYTPTNEPTNSLDVDGSARFRAVSAATFGFNLNITADGTLTTQTSDIRLKENIEPLTNSLEKLLRLTGVTYNWIGQEGKRIGFIAQEVEKVIPELVFINENTEDKIKGIHLDNITAVLVESIKEQQKIIEELKTRITNLENGI